LPRDSSPVTLLPFPIGGMGRQRNRSYGPMIDKYSQHSNPSTFTFGFIQLLASHTFRSSLCLLFDSRQ